MRIAWGRRYCAVPPQLLHPTGYNPSLYRVAVGSAVPFTSGHGRAHTLPDSLDTPLMLLSASSPAPQYSTLRRCWATRYHIHSPILTHTPPIIPCHGHGAGAGGAGITGRGRTGVCSGVVRTTLGGRHAASCGVLAGIGLGVGLQTLKSSWHQAACMSSVAMCTSLGL